MDRTPQFISVKSGKKKQAVVAKPKPKPTQEKETPSALK